MYKIIFAIVLTGLLGGIALYSDKLGKVTYSNPEPQVIEKTVEVSEIEARIKAAQNASSSEIEAAAQSAYQAEYDRRMLEVELEVTRQFRTEVEQKELELEEKISF